LPHNKNIISAGAKFLHRQLNSQYNLGMKKIWMFTLVISQLLAACISISPATKAPTALPDFVTSTLPPTKALALPPTKAPVTGTASPSTPVVTSPPNCTNKAVLMEDVTIPDDTRIAAGETFTKTWRFKNTGSCNWAGYTINFLTGDRMDAPDSSPIPETLADATVDVSLELTAPSADGSYSGYYTLKNDAGESIDIGIEKTFWLKIIVGNPSTSPSGTPAASAVSKARVSSLCSFEKEVGYVNQIQSLINSERKKNNLPVLTTSALLTQAAQTHSADMACNSLLSHTGSDGSSMYARITSTGYTASYSEEIIYAGGGPQAAFDWWMNDQPHRDAILNPKSTEMGIAHAHVGTSTYVDYFTVDFASP
jgi:uncharacterized protein YkwD